MLLPFIFNLSLSGIFSPKYMNGEDLYFIWLTLLVLFLQNYPFYPGLLSTLVCFLFLHSIGHHLKYLFGRLVLYPSMSLHEKNGSVVALWFTAMSLAPYLAHGWSSVTVKSVLSGGRLTCKDRDVKEALK